MQTATNKLVVVWALTLTAFLFMGVTVPHTFVPNTTIRADEVNANFAALKAAVDPLQVSDPVQQADIDDLKTRLSCVTHVGGNLTLTDCPLVVNTTAALPSATIMNSGTGSGLLIQLPNSSNGGRGLDVVQSGVGPGVFATSTGGNAVWGITSSISAAGVIGDNTYGEAVVGRNRGGNGVGAVVGRNDDAGYGVRGFNTKNGFGVLGQAGISGGTGVAGRFENVNASNTSDALQVVTNSSGNAARFTGNVVITGNLTVTGSVAKGSGSFRIDHPLDPQNKYLSHSFVESPEMMNVYNGVVTLDGAGEAVVTMPTWFEALNKDFRYQLTAIGAPGPNLYVAEEIADNRFKIAGGKAGGKVSWQVTGIRHDAYALANPIRVEEDKPEALRNVTVEDLRRREEARMREGVAAAARNASGQLR